MKFLTLAAGLCGAVAASEVHLSHGHEHEHEHVHAAKIPTSYESAVMGRRILALSKLGDLSTVFPANKGTGSSEHRPEDVGGVPVGLMDYVADCEDEGNPTLLKIKIATSFRNVEAGSNITLSMRWIPPYPPSTRMSLTSRLSAYIPFLGGGRAEESLYNVRPDSTPDPVPYSAANLPRFSLFGHLESIQPDAVDSVKLASCFTAKHHDAKWWLPGNVIHESEWARLVVTHIYWVGGFGDRAYIGWIPLEEWSSVTKEEWSSIKLPGEQKGWSEWRVNSEDEL